MAARSLYAEQETKGILHESCDIPEKELISYRFLCCGPLTITLLVAGVRVELTTLGFSVPCSTSWATQPIQGTNEIFVGFEPTTDCLTDNYSTNWVKIFSKEKDCRVCLYGCGGWIWTTDLLVMSQASYRTANTPRGCGGWTRTSDLQLMRLTSYHLLYPAWWPQGESNSCLRRERATS